MPVLVVTDLDGTLMDEKTYSVEPARPMINQLIEKGIPVIPCTSKTRAEVEWICRHLLSIEVPMIVENGSAILFLKRLSALTEKHSSPEIDQKVFGLPYDEIRRRLQALRDELRIDLRGFGDMTMDEIIRWTDLDIDEARRAIQREFSEPVLKPEDVSLIHLPELAGRFGLKVTEGNRFLHFLGPDADKGRAVRWFKNFYESYIGKPVTVIGLGDSPNDRDFLASVDIPVIIPRARTGHPDPALVHLSGARIAPEPGPAGWARALHEILREVTL